MHASYAQQPPLNAPVPPPASVYSRPGSLPTSATLPQRPAVDTPNINAQQMQQIHAGGSISPQEITPSVYSQPTSANGTESARTPVPASADKKPDEAAASTPTAQPPAEPVEEKHGKKDKSKPTKLVYGDNEVSPEEKMAKLARYAFVPDHKEQTVVGGGPTIAVTGTIRNSDDVIDPTHF